MSPIGSVGRSVRGRRLPDEAKIPESVVNRWPIDEGSGQTAADSVGNDDLSFNFEQWQSGDWIGGWAKDFDGTDDRGDAATTAPDGDVALYITISFDSDIDSRSYLIGFGDLTGSANDAIGIEFSGTTNELRFAVRDGGGNFENTTHTLPTTGTYRIVGWFDDSENQIRLAVDGDQKSSAEVSDSDFSGLGTFSVGYERGPDRSFYGQILDEPMVADTSPSTEELEDDYDRQPWS